VAGRGAAGVGGQRSMAEQNVGGCDLGRLSNRPAAGQLAFGADRAGFVGVTSQLGRSLSEVRPRLARLDRHLGFHIGRQTCRMVDMALNVKSAEADRLARELAAVAHESLTEAVTIALRERLGRMRNQQQSEIVARLRRLSTWYAALPVQDSRTPDELIGYDEHGLPT
jgi:antitoxin VapB